ncbi:MAG: TRAP transporter small permease [Desulfobacterales bacterium]|nr:TRAP transporter small permease [Desulfobacterales bacterium]
MISTLLKGIDTILNWVLAVIMTAMLIVVSAQVWYRFVLNNPLAWSEELARYLFVWISFLGSAAGIRMNVHLGIDLIDKILSPRGRKIMTLIVNLAIQIFLAVVIYWGIKILNVVQFQKSASMGIPMTYPYLAVPVGSALMLLNSIRNSWAVIFGAPGKEDENV